MLTPQSPPTQEEIARAHRRLQSGQALASSPLERPASPVAFDGSEPTDWTHWGLVLLVLLSLLSLPAYYFLRSHEETPCLAAPATSCPRLSQPPSQFVPAPARLVITAALPTASESIPISTRQLAAPAAPAQPQTQFASPRTAVRGPTYVPSVVGNVPPSALPAPDYAAKERRLTELKDQMESLDTFIRQIRNDPANSHSVDPGGYSYS